MVETGIRLDESSYSLFDRDKEKLTYEIADLKQRAQDITFLKVTRNVQEYLACPDNSAFEAQKQRESQMLETTIAKMKEVRVSLFRSKRGLSHSFDLF